MNRFLKTLLIWILIAVLPLSSAAAAIGMSCAPGHQQAMQGEIAHDGGHVMDDENSNHHAGAGHASSASDTARADTPSDAHQADHSTCSACSAICMGAAAPPPVPFAIPSFSGSEDLIVSAVPRVSGFIPEGLRRPPRQIFA
ncbi:MAG: hypothetical protein V4693_17165 [Pseudomonadota bacterium]